MPVAYHCDTCDAEAPSLVGWYMISVLLLHESPDAPNPPGGRALDQTLPDLVFDRVECRDAWLATAHLTSPAR